MKHRLAGVPHTEWPCQCRKSCSFVPLRLLSPIVPGCSLLLKTFVCNVKTREDVCERERGRKIQKGEVYI